MSNYNDIRKLLGSAVESLPSLSMDNVYSYVPRTIVPPSAIITPDAQRTVSYMVAQGGSGLAEWRFHVMIVIGLVDEEAAQVLAGDLVSPGSELILALQNCMRFVQVPTACVAQMMFGDALYTYARLDVVVTA